LNKDSTGQLQVTVPSSPPTTPLNDAQTAMEANPVRFTPMYEAWKVYADADAAYYGSINIFSKTPQVPDTAPLTSALKEVSRQCMRLPL